MKADPAVTHFPSPIKKEKSEKTAQEKIDYIASRFRDIMDCLGLDLDNPSLKKTPERIAKMYVNEVFAGLDTENFPAVNCFPEEFHHEHKSNTVFTKVSFTSFCEHHFVPMHGFAYIAYIPRDHIIGLSKIPRIVKYFASRPQVQERLTAQIADSLSLILDLEDVAVSLTVQHFCVIARGIENELSHTTTNVLRGKFNDDGNIRREFFEAINRKTAHH